MEQTVHVMKYIFPRQFGLNNVFTLPEDSPVGVEPFKNYAFREDEICRLNHKKRERQPRQADAGNEPNGQPKLPKRLRGQVVELVRKLRVRQRRCPYKALLKHYCPSKVRSPNLVLDPPLTIAAKWPMAPRHCFSTWPGGH